MQHLRCIIFIYTLYKCFLGERAAILNREQLHNISQKVNIHSQVGCLIADGDECDHSCRQDVEQLERVKDSTLISSKYLLCLYQLYVLSYVIVDRQAMVIPGGDTHHLVLYTNSSVILTNDIKNTLLTHW